MGRNRLTATFLTVCVVLAADSWALLPKNSDIFYSETLVSPFEKSFEVKPLREESLRVERQAPPPSDRPVHLPDQEDLDDPDDSEEDTHNATSEHARLNNNESQWLANATRYQVSHRYYTVITHDKESGKFDEFWQDTAALSKKKGTQEPQHKQLSNSYRRAVSQKLSFKFPFYGHYTENITIATGGFVYVGEHVHSWLAATQYIAPLMANFDTTTSDDANVLFADTGDMFVVEWNQVVLRHQSEAGNFTFQVVLHKNGDIWFVYKSVPIPVKKVSDLHHPLKVGLSDAYLFTHMILTMSRRVIYEYHRIELPLEAVRSGVVFEIKAMPVCISYQSCSECMNSTLAQFNCSWCAVSADHGGSFCSDEAGLHRRRQDWLNAQCNKQIGQVYCSGDDQEKHATGGDKSESADKQNQTTASGGKAASTLMPDKFVPMQDKGKKASTMEVTAQKIHSGNGMSSGSVVALLFVLGTVIGLVGWVVYAYYNPHTPSGQFLIRYRPSRWRLPGSHGDVRYTASVHM